jgi:ribosomal protein S18 acetylase RimI-like enzyme
VGAAGDPRGGEAAPEIGALRPAETGAAAQVLARAFRDNPMNLAVIASADPGRRLRSNLCGARATLEGARERGDVWAARARGRVLGVLVGAPPGAWPLPPPSAAARLRALWVQGRRVTRRWGVVFEALAELHPPGPHWYLGSLGVEPAAQGRGIGTALLRHWLRRVGGAPAYLETDLRRNLAFYEREGFRVVQRAEVLRVPVWCLER